MSHLDAIPASREGGPTGRRLPPSSRQLTYDDIKNKPLPTPPSNLFTPFSDSPPTMEPSKKSESFRLAGSPNGMGCLSSVQTGQAVKWERLCRSEEKEKLHSRGAFYKNLLRPSIFGTNRSSRKRSISTTESTWENKPLSAPTLSTYSSGTCWSSPLSEFSVSSDLLGPYSMAPHLVTSEETFMCAGEHTADVPDGMEALGYRVTFELSVDDNWSLSTTGRDTTLSVPVTARRHTPRSANPGTVITEADNTVGGPCGSNLLRCMSLEFPLPPESDLAELSRVLSEGIPRELMQDHIAVSLLEDLQHHISSSKDSLRVPTSQSSRYEFPVMLGDGIRPSKPRVPGRVDGNKLESSLPSGHIADDANSCLDKTLHTAHHSHDALGMSSEDLSVVPVPTIARCSPSPYPWSDLSVDFGHFVPPQIHIYGLDPGDMGMATPGVRLRKRSGGLLGMCVGPDAHLGFD